MDAKYKLDFLFKRITASRYDIKAFAREMGVAPDTLERQLRGELKFSQADLMKIRKVLYPKKTLCEMMKMCENAA